MRILLVRPKQPKRTHGLRHIMICEPLELEYIAAGVPDHEVYIHDMLVENNYRKILMSYKPDMIGTSCYINNVCEALEICKIAKEYSPQIKTVMGGVHAVLNPQDFESKYIDFIVHGEGITTFRDLIYCLENKADPLSIDGIGFRLNGEFLYTERREFPKDVDQFPFPLRKLTERNRDKYFYLNWKPLSLIRTSWGCPYKCSFCYNRQLTDDNYFLRKVESVINELAIIKSEHVFIIDDTFLFNKKWLEKFCTLLRQRKIQKEFIVYGRTDFVAHNKEILERLSVSGLSIIRVGMEAVTNEELKCYNKRNTVECNDKAIEVCREIGIDLSASFIIPPHYTKMDFERIRKYILNKGLVYIFINPLTPLPGTEIYKSYKDQLIIPYQQAYALWDFQHCVLKPTRITLKAFYRYMGMIYLCAFNPFRIKRLKLRRKPSLSIFSLKALKMYKNLIIILLEVFFAYRDHDKAIK